MESTLKQGHKLHKLNSLIHQWYLDISNDPQEILLKPFNMKQMVFLERCFQNYKSKKIESLKTIQLSFDMKIDFERMIAFKNEEGGKEFNIKRKNQKKVEMNLMDFQYDNFEWRNTCLLDSSFFYPQYFIIWYDSKKSFPSLSNIIEGLKQADQTDDRQIISLSNKNEYWKIIEKAFNYENKNEIISAESLQDPNSNIVSILAFLLALDPLYLKSQYICVDGYVQNKTKKFKQQIHNHSQELGPLQFCLRFGLFIAQKKKKNQLPQKFSLWSFSFFDKENLDRFFDLSVNRLKSLEKNIKIGDCRMFLRSKVTDLDEDAVCLLADQNLRMVQLQIDIEERDQFDHFSLESLQYSPYFNDQRVIVSNTNVYSIYEITTEMLENGTEYDLIKLKQEISTQQFKNIQEDLKIEFKTFKQLIDKTKKEKIEAEALFQRFLNQDALNSAALLTSHCNTSGCTSCPSN